MDKAGLISLVVTAVHIVFHNSNAEQVARALGMESGRIPNSAITGSCGWKPGHEPSNGRLNRKATPGGAGAWTAGSDDLGEWIQVDLLKKFRIVKVATQGREDSDEWVSSFTLSHSEDGRQFELYNKEKEQVMIFTGNTDRNSIVYHELDLPVIARYIRCHPWTWIGHPSMRLEFYGTEKVKPRPPVKPAPPECKKAMDLGIILDSSDSVGATSFATAKEFVSTMVGVLPVSPKHTRVGIITYNKHPTVHLKFSSKKGQNIQKIKKLLKHIRYTRGKTRTDKALEMANRVLFKRARGRRSGKQKALLVLTDGRTNKGSKPYSKVLAPLKRKYVRIIAVGIGQDIKNSELLQIANGVKKNVIPVSDFDDLFWHLEKILKTSCAKVASLPI